MRHELEAGGIGGIGASTKGNVLLQWCGIGPELLPEIGEINPDKLGHVTPGTGIPIVAQAETLARYDKLLVLPWHFDMKFPGKRLLYPLPFAPQWRNADG